MNDKNKKICFFATVHPYYDIRTFHKISKSLLNEGYDVTFIATHDKEEVIDGVKIVPLPPPKNRFERMFVNTYKAFKLALKQDADIYQYPDSELHFVAFLLKLFTRKIVIHDIHEHYSKDIMAKSWIPKHYRKAYLFGFNVFERLFVPHLDALIYVVPSIKERYPYFKNKMIEVRNYPIQEMFASISDNKIESNRDYNRIIFSGVMCPERGIREIIKAFSIVVSKIPDAKLDLAGKFSTIGSSKEETFKDEIEKMVTKYNLDNNIIIHGSYEQDELTDLLTKSAIGLVLYLPTSGNNVIGLPNKIFEYMACKMPVVCSNFPLYEEVVLRSNCGFSVDPNSSEKIAEKLIALLSDIKLIKDMGLSGYNQVNEKYNWKNEFSKLLNLYETLLEGNSK